MENSFTKIKYTPHIDKYYGFNGDTILIGDFNTVLKDCPEISPESLENADANPNSWVAIKSNDSNESTPKTDWIGDVTSSKEFDLMCPNCGSYNVKGGKDYSCNDCGVNSNDELVGIKGKKSKKDWQIEKEQSSLGLYFSKRASKPALPTDDKDFKPGDKATYFGLNVEVVEGKGQQGNVLVKDIDNPSDWSFYASANDLIKTSLIKQSIEPFQIDDIIGDMGTDTSVPTGAPDSEADMNDIDMSEMEGMPGPMSPGGGDPEGPSNPPGGPGGASVAPQVDDTDWDNMFVENNDNWGQQLDSERNAVDTTRLV